LRATPVLLIAVVLAGSAGCTPWWQAREADPAVAGLVAEARSDAGKLPESPERDALVGRLETIQKLLLGEQTPETSRAISSRRWYELFGPKACEISYFTKYADFDGDGAADGLMARLRLEDGFGDPVKALGAFRIETFRYQGLSLEQRGEQFNNWYVSVRSKSDLARYYDSIDRSFRFPLKFASPPEGDRLVVEATYYLPDGSGKKLFGRRVIKAGQ
jgi:hypothetical protein